MNHNLQQHLKALAGDHACYVLITCDTPSPTGDMQVKMSYEGDSALASYLIKGAQSYFEEGCDDSDEQEEEPLKIRIVD